MFGCWRFAVVLIFVEEAHGTDCGGQLRLRHLQGDLAFVLQVVGEVDGRHSALPNHALDRIAAVERRVEAVNWVGHGGPGGKVLNRAQTSPRFYAPRWGASDFFPPAGASALQASSFLYSFLYSFSLRASRAARLTLHTK